MSSSKHQAKEMQDYLLTFMPILTEALTEISLKHPVDPYAYLSSYLLTRSTLPDSDIIKEKLMNHALGHKSVQRTTSIATSGLRNTPLKLIIAGPPCAGKGTQCEHLKAAYGLVHISTGDLLREAIADGTELGKVAKEYMDEGKLLPDDIIIDLVKERLAENDCQENGWLLDGFPRTQAQAEALTHAGIIPDQVLLLEVIDDILIDRVTGRRMDKQTGKIYHLVTNPPPADIPADRLIQRSDDTAEKMRTRLRAYHDAEAHIKAHFAKRLKVVDGNRHPKEVTKSLDHAISIFFPHGPLKVIISGPPAAGKGTQCEHLKRAYNLVHISTGDLLRAAVEEGTDLGKIAKEYMNEGRLIPDDLIISMVKNRLNHLDCMVRGWLLDGFPRTQAQAQALTNAGIVPDHVLLLEVPDKILVDRVTGRRMDKQTGKIYHIVSSPPPADIPADRLIQRADDTAEKLTTRLHAYHEAESHIRHHFGGKLVAIDGNRHPTHVQKDIDHVLTRKNTSQSM